MSTGFSSTGPSYGSITERSNEQPSMTTSDGNALFVKYNEQISSNIYRISRNTSDLERCTKQIGTENDGEALRNRILDIEHRTKPLISETMSMFKQLQRARLEKPRKLQIDRLMGQCQETVTFYSRTQKRTVETLRNVSLSVVKQSTFPGSTGFDDKSEEERLLNEQRREQLMAEDAQIEQDVELLRHREEQIRNLEADIVDVNEIFRDLHAMVREQGEVIDRIDVNVERAHDQVDSGVVNLSRAADYQKRARKKACCLAVTAVIVAGVIALIITLSIKLH